jgi:hypothetical protein
MERFIKGSGEVTKNMVMEYKNGQMEHVTKECGKTAKRVAKGNFGM